MCLLETCQRNAHLESSKVDDAVDIRVFLEYGVELLLVGDVGLVKRGSLSRNELDAVEGDLGGVVEVIYNDDLVAVLQKSQRREGANVAGSTAGSLCQNVGHFGCSSKALFNGLFCNECMAG